MPAQVYERLPLTAIQVIRQLFPRLEDDPGLFRSRASGSLRYFSNIEKTDPLDLHRVICWPANLFAVTSRLLEVTDAYKQTVCRSSRLTCSLKDASWPPDLRRLKRTNAGWEDVLECLALEEPDETSAGGGSEKPKKKVLRWRTLVGVCGKAWREHLNQSSVNSKRIDYRCVKEAPQDRLILELADTPYLLRLYESPRALWKALVELAAEPLDKEALQWKKRGTVNRTPASDGDLKNLAERNLQIAAARGICLFWDHVLGKLVLEGERPPRGEEGVFELLKDWDLFVSVLSLHAIADEAAVGWGTHKPEQFGDTDDLANLLCFVEAILNEHGTLALTNTACCRVLPKRHTPSVGMTLRNYSLNLAFHQSPVEVRWHQEGSGFGLERKAGSASAGGKHRRPLTSISVLLLPWPLRVDSADFGPLSPEGWYFKYAPRAQGSTQGRKAGCWAPSLRSYVDEALKAAERANGPVHLVVFPEMALTEPELDTVERVLRKKGHLVPVYVAGVRARGRARFGRVRFWKNMIYCRTWGPMEGKKKARCVPVYRKDWGGRHPKNFGPREGKNEVQHKHHRWCLDRRQIRQYQLGGALTPTHLWWEGTELKERRSVRFINIGGELTLCPLICEDLARQEPIGDLIRAVGPNIVVAILMDGPQDPARWSARYASVLADDPGSAVVTLTSLGMMERCQSTRPQESRAIALWSDSAGRPQPIELKPDADAVLLSVVVEEHKETTADGREDHIPTNVATLGGVHQIRVWR